MNEKEKEILNVVLDDVYTLNIDLEKDDNKYYFNLVVGNIKDLLKDVYDEK